MSRVSDASGTGRVVRTVVGDAAGLRVAVGFGVAVAAAVGVALAVPGAGAVFPAPAAPTGFALPVPLAAAGGVTGVVRARVTFGLAAGFGFEVGSEGGVWSAICLA